MQAKAPYRFVPLSEKIVSPYWADVVAHDIPFEDSLSGTLAVELTAHSPIFISNGKKREGDDKEVLEFSNFEGKHFIPSTSLKGMIRNLLEIMSFGNIKSMTQDNKYAFRDLSINKEQYLVHFKPDRIFCGYLRKTNEDEFYITDCGIPGRISQAKIDKYFNTSMAIDFDTNGKHTRNAGDEGKSAIFKSKNYRTVCEVISKFQTSTDSAGKLIAEIDKYAGTKEGKIVFTGQPGPNKLSSNNETRKGKHYEFVFFQNGDEPQKKVEESVIKDFKFAYFDHDKNRWSKDWKHRRKQLDKGEEIPVFFHKNNKGEIIRIGLSYLFKLSYKNSVHDIIKHTQKNDHLGLAEIIFGNIKEKNDALKGRVAFSNAWLTDNKIISTTTCSEVLASPKASFYPFYLKQSGKLVTYMNKAELSGWKRYPIHKTIKKNKSPNGNENIMVHFRPLPTGSKFTFTINYHNLRKIELGGLLSALTHHNCEEAFHSIGMGKPLGYGKIKLQLQNKDDDLYEECMKNFEAYMSNELGTKWLETTQIKKLIEMCCENEELDSQLKYMQLKEHVEVKKGKAFLSTYSTEQQLCTIVLCDEEYISTFSSWLKNDKEKYKLLGNIEKVVHQFQEEEKIKLKAAFEQKKLELIQYLKNEKQKRKEEERAARDEKFQKEKEERIATIKSQSLEESIGDKRTKTIKDLKNLVEQYGSKKYDCKRANLTTTFSDGYIKEEEDIHFISSWLKNSYQNGGKSIQKQLKHPFSRKHPIFKEVIKWLGEEKAQVLYNQIIK